MAGETKILKFAEGVSVDAPAQSFLSASNIQSYVDDAAYVWHVCIDVSLWFSSLLADFQCDWRYNSVFYWWWLGLSVIFLYRAIDG